MHRASEDGGGEGRREGGRRGEACLPSEPSTHSVVRVSTGSVSGSQKLISPFCDKRWREKRRRAEAGGGGRRVLMRSAEGGEKDGGRRKGRRAEGEGDGGRRLERKMFQCHEGGRKNGTEELCGGLKCSARLESWRGEEEAWGGVDWCGEE